MSTRTEKGRKYQILVRKINNPTKKWEKDIKIAYRRQYFYRIHNEELQRQLNKIETAVYVEPVIHHQLPERILLQEAILVCLAYLLAGSSFLESDSVYSTVTGGTVVTTMTMTTTVTAVPTTSATSTPTTGFTNLFVPAPSTVTTVSLNCPSISSTTYTAYNSSNIFAITCSIGYPGGHPGNEDVTKVVAYSLQDCLEACSQLPSSGFTPCAGATFASTMSVNKYGNCFLKGSLGTRISSSVNTFAFGKLLIN
jgi:hypothetical protein